MKKAMLIILDGFGIGKDYPGNAVKLAKTPVIDSLFEKYPHSSLKASGLSVGLPEGQMGNSEVGHLNIGSGRIIYQELTKLNKEIEEGSFFNNEVLLKAMLEAKMKKKALHLMGLVSDGGVHSHNNHLYALLRMAKIHDLERVYVHAFLDGRDVPPTVGASHIEELLEKMKEIGSGSISTVIGRYYAMDRDKRWDRTEKAYDAITMGKGHTVKDPVEAIKGYYKENITDEFMEPIVVLDDDNQAKTVEDDDTIIFFNFRPDRARQLSHAFTDTVFEAFERKKEYSHLHYVTMTDYDKSLTGVNIAYPKESYKNTLGEVISQKGLRQLRIAETEKYAHVTFFFNGGVELANEGEDRILIPSPKVATYDLLPEMSAYKVTDELINKIKEDDYSLIILNFANCDMVGHTGVLSAAIKAVETVDTCLGRIVEEAVKKDYALLITADHGNSEKMIDEESSSAFTAHTTNPVPLIGVNLQGDVELADGILSDLSPSILDIMGIKQPIEMTGKSLIIRRS